jgi:hypothetical protein
MTKNDLKEHDKENVRFTINGKTGNGRLNYICTEERFQIIGLQHPTQGSAVNAPFNLTDAMCEATVLTAGELSLDWQG